MKHLNYLGTSCRLMASWPAGGASSHGRSAGLIVKDLGCR